MLIIGHRGAKGLAPENTVESINKALEHGVDMVEVDVRMHAGELVLSHDPTLHTGDYCLLADALKAVNGKVRIILEIKEERVIPKLKKILESYNGEFTISSKVYSIIDRVRDALPEAHVAITEKWSGVRAVAEASLLDTNEIHFNHNWLWAAFVRSMKHKGYIIYAYTVNSRERAEELESWGIDGIFTDHPELFNDKGDIINE